MITKLTLASKVLTNLERCILILLVTLPSIALFHILRSHSATFIYAVIGYILAIQLITFFQVRKDKLKALAGEWRISESILHSLELAGGWPASLASQRKYRHKTSKKSYQFIFWLVILFYQLLATDLLFNGPISSIIKFL